MSPEQRAPASKKTRSRTQQERSAETRAKLIDATIELLHRKGAAKLSMIEVAGAAGVTRGAIQHHFGSPEGLLEATVVAIADRIHERVNVRSLSDLPLPDRVAQVVDHYWRVVGSTTYTAMVEVWVNARFDPNLARILRKKLDELAKSREVEWAEVFSDCPIGREALSTLRLTLLATLRGLALRSMLIKSPATTKDQIAALKDMMLLYLEDATPSSAAPGRLTADRGGSRP